MTHGVQGEAIRGPTKPLQISYSSPRVPQQSVGIFLHRCLNFVAVREALALWISGEADEATLVQRVRS